MNDNIRKQIYTNLNLRETDELLEIWRTNDRLEWTEIAFDVIQAILQERHCEVPPQDQPVYEHVHKQSDTEGFISVLGRVLGKLPADVKSAYDELIVDNSKERFLDNENAPVFYKPKEVLWLKLWLNRTALAAIVITIIAGLPEFPTTQRVILSYFLSNPAWNLIAWIITIVVDALVLGLQCFIIFFSLKALGSILQILMEMEFNSRSVK